MPVYSDTYWKKKEHLDLPEGWKRLSGYYKNISIAIEWADFWNDRNDGFFYKIFPLMKTRDSSFIIAKKSMKGE
jgi:hypothetical protein